MIGVFQLLQKYQTFKDGKSEREKLATTLSEHIVFQLTNKDLVLKDGVLLIKTHPAVKNEIFLKKASIICFLNNSLVGASIKDIK